MKKNFDLWNKTKKGIHQKPSAPFCHPREIWWCALGVNVGFEQDGTGARFDRPIVVIRGFNAHTFLGVALTGKKKTGKYYFSIGQVENREASAIVSQIRLIDTKRLVRKMTTLDTETFTELKVALQRVLFG